MAKILVVGRDVDPLDSLRQQLLEGGFEVAACASLKHAPEMAVVEQPDMILLELRPDVPPLDALSACQLISPLPGGPDLPLVVLGDVAGTVDKVALLEHGADDFISRPYDSRELLARIRALLRRTARASERRGLLVAGQIELDVERYTASLAGAPLELTAKEFELLRMLIEARGRIVRREAALERVWSYGRDSGIETRTLDVHVRRLRNKLGPEGDRIVTIRSVGYRMDVASEWILYGE